MRILKALALLNAVAFSLSLASNAGAQGEAPKAKPAAKPAPAKAAAKPAPRASKPAPRKSASGGGAAAAPRVSSAELNGYVNRVIKRSQDNWYVPDGNNHVVVQATVNPSGGYPTDISASSSPSNPDAEKAALEAFNKSLPLDAVPGGQDWVLKVIFDSKADPHGDSSSKVSAQLDPPGK